VNVKENLEIKRFRRFLQVEKGLSENSVYSYTYDLKKFSEFLEDQNKSILSATQDDIVRFLANEKTKKQNSDRKSVV
jgi:integrase/recombinase XerD